jgi:hypothetical protein
MMPLIVPGRSGTPHAGYRFGGERGGNGSRFVTCRRRSDPGVLGRGQIHDTEGARMTAAWSTPAYGLVDIRS